MPRAKLIPLVLAGLFALAGVAQAGPTYQLTSLALDWASAQAEATALGGHLAVINSEAEQIALANEFGIPDSEHGNLGGVWLGLKAISDGPYSWVNGDALSYLNWGLDQPQGLDGIDSFAFMSVFDGKWYTDEFGRQTNPNDTLFGIIEIPDPTEVPPTEEPPTEEPPTEEPPAEEPPTTGGPNNLDSPEPATVVMLAIGGLGLAGFGLHRRRNKNRGVSVAG